MIVEPIKQSLCITFVDDEIRYLREITQNYIGAPSDEIEQHAKIRLSLFVAASRALGYDMKDDGTIDRTSFHDRVVP